VHERSLHETTHSHFRHIVRAVLFYDGIPVLAQLRSADVCQHLRANTENLYIVIPFRLRALPWAQPALCDGVARGGGRADEAEARIPGCHW
jgi:hypothetical protein